MKVRIKHIDEKRLIRGHRITVLMARRGRRRRIRYYSTLSERIRLHETFRSIVRKSKKINEMISYIDGLRSNDIPF